MNTRKTYRHLRKKYFQILYFQKEKPYRDICKSYDFNGYKRIYFYHIRKSAGISLSYMFLNWAGYDGQKAFRELGTIKDHRIIKNNLIVIGWDQLLINMGNYFYAFSHHPAHKLILPRSTYTLTCFRDPSKRVISHYNMLTYYVNNNINHPCLATEGKWLGNSYSDFLENIPKQHLLNQLYMFSPSFNVNEAVKNIQKLSFFFFAEEFNKGVDKINQDLNLNLTPLHAHSLKTDHNHDITQKELNHLRDKLVLEYELMEILHDIYNQKFNKTKE